MRYSVHYIFLLLYVSINSQTINLNESHLVDYLRISQLKGELNSKYSMNIKPIDIDNFIVENQIFNKENYSPTILNFFNNKGKLKVLPIDYNIEYNSHHPYNRNNGSMIPNRGYQQLVSAGLYLKIGIFAVQLKPEHLYSQNMDFEGFGEGPNGHYPKIWAKRYELWNHIDMPERFGEKEHKKTLIGQSSIKINYKGLSLGISNENIWWGPSIRNSIMMSNHARGFKHITFNTTKPLKTKIGNFEWQIISGRLESSGYTPPNTDMMYAGTKIYNRKINQLGQEDDWRYLQGYIINYSPKWVPGLSLGFMRWVQMYSALVKGEYFWMPGSVTWFPAFKNIFRKNDLSNDLEAQTNQAAGLFFRWLWKDSKAEIYAEYHYNDSKQNLRDLLVDSDHSRAVTVGIQKIFSSKNNDYLFSWEWTQMEQNASRLLRDAGSWYEHTWTYDGFTNEGEVLGSSIGPGSNSQYFSISRVKKTEKLGIAFEIIDQDNDFYHEAFISAQDYRRYWKDFNFHINFSKKINNFWLSSNLMFSRSLNYQWDLDDTAPEYYRPGNDVNNFHFNLKMSYLIPILK